MSNDSALVFFLPLMFSRKLLSNKWRRCCVLLAKPAEDLELQERLSEVPPMLLSPLTILLAVLLECSVVNLNCLTCSICLPEFEGADC